MEKKHLTVDTIYHLKDGLEGLKVCILESNRNNPQKNKRMMGGCKESGMQSPGILTDAIYASKAGYTLLDAEDGHEISDEELNDYLVIVDGNTRFHAWQLAIHEKNPFEYIFQYKDYQDEEKFCKAYQGMNVFNTPTSGADLARDIVARAKNPILDSYRAKSADGLCAKAAGFATIGKEITKGEMVDINANKVPEIFNDQACVRRFQKVYDATSDLRKACIKVFKGTEVWSWIASKVNENENKDDMAERISKMFQNMTVVHFQQLQNAKKEGNRNKEAVVKDLLDKILI